MKMDKMMKECMKPHALTHTLTGVGLGVLLVGLFPSLSLNATMVGLVVLVVGMVADYMVQSGK